MKVLVTVTNTSPMGGKTPEEITQLFSRAAVRKKSLSKRLSVPWGMGHHYIQGVLADRPISGKSVVDFGPLGVVVIDSLFIHAVVLDTTQ